MIYGPGIRIQFSSLSCSCLVLCLQSYENGMVMVNVSYHPILLTSLLPEQYFVVRDVARSDQRWR